MAVPPPTAKTTIKILDKLNFLYPEARNALLCNDYFYTVLAIALSSRTTDEQVGKVIKTLRMVAPTYKELALIGIKRCEEIIRPIGFYKVKSLRAVALAKVWGSFIEEGSWDRGSLMKLPGVGRKSANLILSTLFDSPTIAVDTHVSRVSKRIGWSSSDNPIQIEQDLENVVPATRRSNLNVVLVAHGRRLCRPRSPICSDCPISQFCYFYKNKTL